MAEEETETEAAEEQKGGLMKKIIMLVGALALLGGGAFAGKTFLGGEPEPEEGEVAEEVEPTDGPAIYQSLHPPLVVNFKDELGDSHFMQITMEVMARDQGVINAVREHTPVIRNELILLYANAIYEQVITREGKEKMLADGLAAIQEVMTEQTGEAGVEAVYFTALVIQ
ncbi:MAG: flagellar basal body-associated FliL family protein [Pseudomonadota bacterium]